LVLTSLFDHIVSYAHPTARARMDAGRAMAIGSTTCQGIPSMAS